LHTPRRPPIFNPVRGNPDYGDKRTCNRRLGPGGGTRRLHQILPFIAGVWGRNRIDGRSKRPAFARWGTTVIGPRSQLPMTTVLRWRWLR